MFISSLLQIRPGGPLLGAHLLLVLTEPVEESPTAAPFSGLLVESLHLESPLSGSPLSESLLLGSLLVEALLVEAVRLGFLLVEVLSSGHILLAH